MTIKISDYSDIIMRKWRHGLISKCEAVKYLDKLEQWLDEYDRKTEELE